MSGLNSNHKVVKLARSLGLHGLDGALAQITEFCLSRIRELTRGEDVETLADLERVVCRKLNLVVEEIRSDDDIEPLVQKYAVAAKDPAFRVIRTHFDGDVFGTTFVRRKFDPAEPDRFVAFIDCRGPKGHRRYFTRWHEIAHLLTLPPKPGMPVNREPVKSSPLEQVMDHIAGTVGFYEPIFGEAVREFATRSGVLGFDEIESIRRRHCPTASFQATLIAAVPKTPTPVVYLEAKPGLKNEQRTRDDPGQQFLFARDVPEEKLRLAKVTANEAARRIRLRFDRNMEVPQESIIYKLHNRLFVGFEPEPGAVVESLAVWRHSDGTTLGSSEVVVEARRLPDRVYALVRPR